MRWAGNLYKPFDHVMEISGLLGIGRFIIDLFSFPAADNQPSRFQLLEVMGNRRAAHVHHSRKVYDAFLTVTQQPKNTDMLMVLVSQSSPEP